MGRLLESESNLYVAAGVLSIVVFAVGLGAVVAIDPDGVGERELFGLVAGFSLYMVVYFVSMGVYRLVTMEPGVERR